MQKIKGESLNEARESLKYAQYSEESISSMINEHNFYCNAKYAVPILGLVSLTFDCLYPSVFLGSKNANLSTIALSEIILTALQIAGICSLSVRAKSKDITDKITSGKIQRHKLEHNGEVPDWAKDKDYLTLDQL
jgi:hypothetical protein